MFKCDSSLGEGVGDDGHSWAFDGFRRQRWHGRAGEQDGGGDGDGVGGGVRGSPWGRLWRTGDVVGCAADVGTGDLVVSSQGMQETADAKCVVQFYDVL